jgi:hypothetical protein
LPVSLPNGSLQNPYSQIITAVGASGQVSFTVTSGTLPSGLDLSQDGVVSGIPVSAGTFIFNVTATDENTCSGNREYTLAISCLFCDYFEDGSLDPNWLYLKQAWSEDGHNLVGTPLKRKAIAIADPVFSGCSNCSIETTISTADNGIVWLFGWYVDKKNSVELLMKEASDKWVLKERINGQVIAKSNSTFTINPNTFYHVRLEFDGIKFIVSIDGTPIMTLHSTANHTGTIGFQVKNVSARVAEIVVN